MVARRKILKVTSAGLGVPLLSSMGVRQVWAQPKRIVALGGGGGWADMLREGLDKPFEQATGVAVLQDRTSAPVQRVTKLKVNLADQPFDVVLLTDGLIPLAASQGVLEKLNPESPNMPNLNLIPARYKSDYAVGMIYSLIGITYNTKLVKEPPKSYADLWRPEFKGKIVLPDVTHAIGPYIVPVGALADGKDVKDADAGFEMLRKLAKLEPIWVPDTDSIMNSMRNEEASIALLYKSQTFTLKDEGVPVEWSYPQEGGILYVNLTGIAKGTRNLDLAEKYINMTLDPQIQTICTKRFNFSGTNPKMLDYLTPELRERAQFTDEQLQKMISLDQEWMAARRADWTQRWNKIIAG